MFAKRKTKSALKKIICFMTAKRINRALHLAGKCEIVSFDIFDTLIFRKCRPAEVFDIAEGKYNASHDDKIHSFRQARIEAERKAYRKSFFREVTFDEIYDELANEYGWKFAEDMKSIEIQAEFDVIYPNEDARKFYDLMREKGKRIVITSDMYLPKNVIAEMLKQCGYEGYESLYVSSAFRKRKSDGTLFKHIIRDKEISPSEILHIGDNMNSDYVMARREGIKGFLCKK